jgi:hypothetical protein
VNLVQGNESAAKSQESLVNIISPFVADTQSPEPIEPGESSLHDPAVFPQSLARFNASSGNPGSNPSLAQQLSAERVVVSFVGMYLVWPETRASRSGGVDSRDCIDDGLQRLAIVPVGARHHQAQRRAMAVDRKMALRALFAAIRRVRSNGLSFDSPLLRFLGGGSAVETASPDGGGPPGEATSPVGGASPVEGASAVPGAVEPLSGLVEPLSGLVEPLSGLAKGAATLAASTLTLDQSICPASANRSSRARRRSSQTPACCHSRSRLQQVMPAPQPISWGSISQGMPDSKTNKMPVRVARAGTRGRPPLGLGLSGGSSGLIVFQSSSLTSCLAITQLFYQVSPVLLEGLSLTHQKLPAFHFKCVLCPTH